MEWLLSPPPPAALGRLLSPKGLLRWALLAEIWSHRVPGLIITLSWPQLGQSKHAGQALHARDERSLPKYRKNVKSTIRLDPEGLEATLTVSPYYGEGRHCY